MPVREYLWYSFWALLYAKLAFSDSSLTTTGNITPSSDVVGEGKANGLLDHVPDAGHTKNALITTDSLLFASTLDGTLFAVSKTTGKVMWSLKEDPVLRIPVDVEKGPVFVANPKDGSLYSFKMGFDGLKKLPFSIPDLVTVSPCRSTDGLLYTGSKTDTWFAVDPLTGIKIQTLNMDGSQQVCPSGSISTVFIGRTEYKVVMFDSETRQPRWNATFMDYSSHVAPDNKDYDLQHFASSSSGVIVTMDPEDGDVLWTRDLMSPIVGMYTLNQDHGFQKVPFFSVAKETLYHLTGQMTSSDWRRKFIEHGKQETMFYPTLYVGEHNSRLYAVPSLVDVSTVSVTPKNFGRLLLEGPMTSSSDSVVVVETVQDDLVPSAVEESNLILLGYHEVPDISARKLYYPSMRLIADKSTIVIPVQNEKVEIGVNRSQLMPEKVINYNVTDPQKLPSDNSGYSETKFLTAVLIGFLFAAAFICSIIERRFHFVKESSKAVISNGNYLWQQQISADDGLCTVGKITFNPSEVLGHGCEGTLVYKGRFDGRDVAVKRLIPHNFHLADREAELLRESDQHQNVIRYYCTERDVNFQYIAFELCMATVHDYVEKADFDKSCINAKTLLQQMMSGIAHLHLLKIVHRDIKPQNVLLSRPDAHGRVHAMISDFGLCKKLLSGRQSLSKASGVMGTIGWIAPEMMNSENKITFAVDIFSAGCVIYYVLSNGKHPFSDALNRQANIQSGNYDLSALSETESELVLARNLVTKMVNPSPAERPTTVTILKHPYFWSPDEQLRFLEAVSNRLEKIKETDPLVVRLESKAHRAVSMDWSQFITEDLKQDLRKFRAYKYYTVRDLLRAIRNKHHHFAELGKDLQDSLGCIPDEYLAYFTSRFPKLVLHVYDAMSWFTSEPSFQPFY